MIWTASNKNKEVPEKVTIENELLVQQYQSLRSEILEMQKSNDGRFGQTLVACTVIWGFVVSIVASGKFEFLPSSILLLSSLLSMVALSKHATNNKRVVNIGAFIAMAYDNKLDEIRNWEFQIKEFAQAPPVDLSSSLSIQFLYDLMIRVGVYTALLATYTNLTIYSFSKVIFADWTLTSIFSFLIAITSNRRVKPQIGNFADDSKKLHEYWKEKQQGSSPAS